MGLFGEAAAFTAAVFLMLVGLLGVILPVIPGLVLVWVGVLIFALVDKFAIITPWIFIGLSALAILGISAEIWMAQLGAKMGGATFKSQLVGLVGGVLGALLIPLLGGLIEALLGPVLGGILAGILAALGAVIGSIVGVLGAEYYRLREWNQAFRAGCGWLLGWVTSTLFQLFIGALMIILFLWQAYSG
jgi:uncharacterized protein YqgC (DUF456 family)